MHYPIGKKMTVFGEKPSHLKFILMLYFIKMLILPQLIHTILIYARFGSVDTLSQLEDHP